MPDRRFVSALAAEQNTTETVVASTARPRGSASAVVVAATLVVAAACWVVSVRQMIGMDMGVATELGSFGSFAALWMAMMGAMMLPGALPAVIRNAHANRNVLAAPWFIVTYLALWAIVGLVVYALYRPHGSAAAAAIVIAAGVYELTPVKRYFRRRCNRNFRSGFDFGCCCVGSSIGLMLMLVALGIMNIAWMVIVAVVITAQKLMPPKAAIDVSVALAIVGLGIFVAIAPASIPGLIPMM